MLCFSLILPPHQGLSIPRRMRTLRLRRRRLFGHGTGQCTGMIAAVCLPSAECCCMLLLRVLWMQQYCGLAGCACVKPCGRGGGCACGGGGAGGRDTAVQRECVLQNGSVHDAGQSLGGPMLDQSVHPGAVLPRLPQLALVGRASGEPLWVRVLHRPHPGTQVHQVGAAAQRGGPQRVRRTLQWVANAERIGNAAAHSQLVGGRPVDGQVDLWGTGSGCPRPAAVSRRVGLSPRGTGSGGGGVPLEASLRHVDVSRVWSLAGWTGVTLLGRSTDMHTPSGGVRGAEGGRKRAPMCIHWVSQSAAATASCPRLPYTHRPPHAGTANARMQQQQRAMPWRRRRHKTRQNTPSAGLIITRTTQNNP